MLAKNSNVYDRALNALGVAHGLYPNIPENILDCSQVELDEMRSALNKLNLGKYSRECSERMATRLICGMLPSRPMRYAKPNSRSFYRGFFVVSDVGLSVCDILLEGQRVMYMYGGKCLQSVTHYHYVLTVEYSIRTQSIHIAKGKCNVSGVESSVMCCKRYIDGQLIGDKYCYSVCGVDDYRKGVGDSVSCGGKYTTRLGRCGELVVKYSCDGEFVIDAPHSVWYMKYAGMLTSVVGYRCEYCIKVVIKHSSVDEECISFVKCCSALSSCRVLVISRV